ncbi:hypothetical protein LEL_10887 [Akanthomyces lecanii RCEF 1005]|uniref:Uncharacterized protein n=1 Tax=Akanthomyces lecanii RCEF 1005 TaxID=1081108 RepID=A0A167R810_CORDF|nr:hypothetical protein LEL_10887 [Akanthomyces lecanii RCEF 1005]
MSALAIMMQNPVAEAQASLAELAVCAEEGIAALPKIPWDRPQDDVGRADRGFWFLMDERNQ